MSSSLYDKQNYSNGIDYYSGYIVEYDLRKANISALLSRGIISTELYTNLLNSDKQYREVYIGNMIKQNNSIYKEIQQGIIDAKRQFIEANNIEDEEILAIRNDALFILSDRPMIQEFGNYYFAKKNIFTFFFRFYKNNEWYYRFDQSTMSDIIEIKGMKDEKLLYHKDHFLKFLADISYNLQRSSIEETLSRCNEFYEDYLNRRLDINYYREFNNNSEFRISFQQLGKSYLTPELQQSDIENLDINFNLRILRDLIKVIDQIYFSQRR